MTIRGNNAVLRQVRTLLHLGSIGEWTDGQLLERFTVNEDDSSELAFEALVERHGPMVLRVCQNSLRDSNDAHDAFQATFLVLVRKARSLWVQDSLGPWLHRVAYRIAGRARESAARRRTHERNAAEGRPTRIFIADDRKELSSLLNEEIDRLPERCRLPIVLCDLEGLTHEQAARRLGWPVGSVKSRLMRGREWLRARLVRRGMAPAIGLFAVTLPAQSAQAVLPARLVEATVEAARLIAAGATAAGVVPSTVAILLEGAMNSMFVNKIRLAMMACGLLTAGTVVVAQQSGGRPETVVLTAKAEAPRNSASTSEAAAIDDVVEREMNRLDLDLLREEVHQLQVQVQEAFREKLRAERRNSGEGMIVTLGAVKVPRVAYDDARASYQTKLRQLANTLQRLEMDQHRSQSDRNRSGSSTPPTNDREGDRMTSRLAPNPPVAVIGSIDMDAILKRYEKFQLAHKDLQDDIQVRREHLLKLDTEAKDVLERMQKLDPSDVSFIPLEQRLTALKNRVEADRESAQREFVRREAQTMAAVFKEIQRTIASLAKSKGINYVVKVSSDPVADANPNDVTNALGRSVLYADPRNDLTEEVVSELNRR